MPIRSTPIRRAAIAMAAFAALLSSGCSNSNPYGPPPPAPPPQPPPPPPPPGSNQVVVSNDQFTPQQLTVNAGQEVSFVWANNSVGHNVTPASATIPSSPGLPALRNAPFSFTVTFPTAGTFNYYCGQHGGPGSGMHGSVVVQ